MLSTVHVENFFVQVLKFPNWSLKSNDVLEFLKQLVQRYQYHCYFHNTDMAATPPTERRTPTKENSIRIGVCGTGGVCIHQNYFLTLILQTIGFNAFTTAGNCVASPEPQDVGNHCMCIVKLNEKEIYALDVGCGQPVDGPIPLHNLPFSGIAAGFRYEYRFNQILNRYERWQFDGTFFRGKFEDPSTSLFRYSFTLVPQDFDYFSTTLVDIFTNPETSIFLKSPFLFRSLDLETDVIGGNGRRYILIFGASMVIYDNVNREVTHFKGYKELKPYIIEYFPKVDPVLIEEALNYFCSISTGLILGMGVE